ncbi:BapA prefix-like domain-containing protein, partial [Alcaligenes nematophilus]
MKMILAERSGAGKPVLETQLADQVLATPHLVKLNASPGDIVSLIRQGNDLVLTMANGQQVTLKGFFNENADGEHSELVLEDEACQLWWLKDSGEFVEVSAQDAVFANTAPSVAETVCAAPAGVSTPPPWVLGLLLAGLTGVAMASGHSSGGSGGGSEPAKEDGTIKVEHVGLDGSITGQTSGVAPGTKVTVTVT